MTYLIKALNTGLILFRPFSMTWKYYKWWSSLIKHLVTRSYLFIPVKELISNQHISRRKIPCCVIRNRITLSIIPYPKRQAKYSDIESLRLFSSSNSTKLWSNLPKIHKSSQDMYKSYASGSRNNSNPETKSLIH